MFLLLEHLSLGLVACASERPTTRHPYLPVSHRHRLHQISQYMSQPYFQFRRFTVRHDTSSMPVGTDGVLLGAWADVEGASRILDIGTGSGLIALMAAQRAPNAQVEAIDVDEPSVRQAQQNVQASPFARRIVVCQADVRTFSPEGGRFDHILSNPPFFVNDVLPPDERRCTARNASALPAHSLMDAAARLLATDGRLSVVLPSSSQAMFVALGLERALYLTRCLRVRTVARKPPKRVLLEFARLRPSLTTCEEMVLQEADGKRSPAYTSLTQDFYL